MCVCQNAPKTASNMLFFGSKTCYCGQECRLETSLYRFNTSSDSQKTDRNSEAIVRYLWDIILAIASEYPSQYIHHT